jgi:branched-chain amino acid transport system ATP-binding protein
MGEDAILQLQSVSIKYGEITGVEDMNLEVSPGKIVALIGANGSGKSSTLNGIIGLVKAQTGRILFEGKDISGLPPWGRAKLGIKMSPEGRRVIADLSVEENIQLGKAFSSTPNKRNIELDELWKMFPSLLKRRGVMAGLLSGGEQQMLAIARAIVTNPKLLLLDEPFLGLAPIVMKEVSEVIKQLKDRGTAILLSEQMARYALPMADIAYIIKLGKVCDVIASEEIQSKGMSILSHYLS